MKCEYCGGRHESEYCLGYNASSMNMTLGEVNEGIAALSEHDDRALEDISDGLRSIHGSFDSIQDSQNANAEVLRGAVTDAQFAISESITQGAVGVGRVAIFGAVAISGSIIAAGAMIMKALTGIGAALQHRERMDDLRHKERLQFDEEISDAGRARRELKAAAALIFAGDPSQAEIHVINSLRLFPSSAETFRIRSVVENLKGEHEKACVSLKAAMKLAEDGDLFPNVMNLNKAVGDGAHEAVLASSTIQLAGELALVSKETIALELLEQGVEKFPANTDLHLARLRTLSKTPAWEKRAAEWIARLVELSPKYFNILFLDQQLGERLGEMQSLLKRLKSSKLVALRNRKQALMLVSQGQAQFEIAQAIEHGSGSFEELAAVSEGVTQEIRRYTKV